MNEIGRWFETSLPPTTLASAALSLILALVLGQAIGAFYMWTFRGLSYTRSFVFTMVSGSIVTCGLMLAIGNSVAAGLGLAGGMALIRFRTSLRDPRDLVFVLASLAAGIGCGLKAWGPTVLSTVCFLGATFIYTWTEFGTRAHADGLLRLELPPTQAAESALASVLGKYTASFALVTLREVAQGKAMQHAYQIRLRSSMDRTPLLKALEQLDGSRDVSLLLQEPTVEI